MHRRRKYPSSKKGGTENLPKKKKRVYATLIASEARKAVGLSRSLAIPQLRVCVYECI